MTGRAKTGTVRIETEIERSREESNWTKVIELAEQLKERSPNYEYLSDFLIGEGRLESYLEEHPPIESNIAEAKSGLAEAKKFLTLASNDMGKKAGVALDAHLLLGKLHYSSGQYSQSLKSYHLAELHALSEKRLPIRSLRIVAESFAIKGMCLEKEAPSSSSKFKKSERDSEMLKCFELASDLGLLYMQELDKQITGGQTTVGSHSPLPKVLNKFVGPIMEQALIKAPVLYMNRGQTSNALERYRATLSAVESSSLYSLRLKLIKQMAELLVQGTAHTDYKPPSAPQTTKLSPWKPKPYTSMNQFVPRNECEEIILVLLIAEAMAVREAVLSQSPEFKDARMLAHQNATSVYDLLTVATVRWGQVALLQESLERAMKFSFKEPHVWEQYALSLLAMGRHVQALAVLKEVIRLQPNSSTPCLIASRLCFEHLSLAQEGTEYAGEAVERESKKQHDSMLLGRCYLYQGIGYQLQANTCLIKQTKSELNAEALRCFQTAVKTEPNDHLCEYYLGLQLALTGRIQEALTHVKIALALRPESSSTLQLLALLLSANRQHSDALLLVEAALEEYPDCLNLMYVKAHLELHEDEGERALCTAKKMLVLWKTLYENQTVSDVPECDRKSDTRSVFQLYTSEMSDKDSSSLRAQSVAASKVEHALSEVASSMSSFNPRPGPQRAWLLQLQVWLLLAELYLQLEQLSAVQQCIQEASQIFALSHHIMYMKGLLHMHKQEYNDAKLCFQNAVAINPLHIKSLQQLGLVYHYLGSQRLAEITLRDAARIDPTNHNTWYSLGKVLESLGEYEAASDCMATALSVETVCPVLPFDSVPLCFE